jgi:DNA-binding NarL/FixJ family response regulator
MSKKHKLLLADDHGVVIDGLTFLFATDPSLELVGAAKDGQEVLDFVSKNEVDAVILDINMPVMDGITCAKKLKDLYPEVRVIILTQYDEKSFITEVAKIADGCVMKKGSGEHLINAIHKVMGDELFFDEFLDDLPPPEPLGKREIEVLKLLGDGLTSEEIAERLFISVHTVKTHRKNMLRKTNKHSTPELLTYAITEQLITPRQ